MQWTPTDAEFDEVFAREGQPRPQYESIVAALSAHERLEAAVHKKVSERKDVASLHQEIGRLDVPVYREPPAPERHSLGVQAGDDQQQQQQ